MFKKMWLWMNGGDRRPFIDEKDKKIIAEVAKCDSDKSADKSANKFVDNSRLIRGIPDASSADCFYYHSLFVKFIDDVNKNSERNNADDLSFVSDAERMNVIWQELERENTATNNCKKLFVETKWNRYILPDGGVHSECFVSVCPESPKSKKGVHIFITE